MHKLAEDRFIMGRHSHLEKSPSDLQDQQSFPLNR